MLISIAQGAASFLRTIMEVALMLLLKRFQVMALLKDQFKKKKNRVH